MEWLGDLIGNGLSGGLFGILGGLGTAWISYAKEKADRAFKLEENKNKRAHELLLITAETDASIKEIEANVKRDQVITEGKVVIAESAGRNEAIVEATKNFVKSSLVNKMIFNKNPWTLWITAPIGLLIATIHSLVDISRSLVRPVITYGSVGFCCFVTYIAFEMYTKLNVVITPEQLFDIIMTMLRLLTFSTSTVIGFWFMDKSMSRKFQNKG